MKRYASLQAICPYYRHEDTQVIYCDSFTEWSVIHLAFESKTDARKYKECMCRKDYQKCPIMQMLEKNEVE